MSSKTYNIRVKVRLCFQLMSKDEMYFDEQWWWIIIKIKRVWVGGCIGLLFVLCVVDWLCLTAIWEKTDKMGACCLLLGLQMRDMLGYFGLYYHNWIGSFICWTEVYFSVGPGMHTLDRALHLLVFIICNLYQILG